MAFTKILGPGIHTLANFHSHNINSSGIITATKFVGDMEPGGGTGSFDSLTVTGNLGVGGTVTYTDVTNVDAIGIITAQSGIHIGAGATIGSFNTTTGISSFKTLNVYDSSTFDASVGIADSIFHIGDTHTAIRFPGNDIITTEIAGAETLRIDGTGLKIVDKLLHSGDPDTMIRFPEANTFTAETNGVERLRITSSGRVGIGTTNPNAPINLRSSDNTLGILTSTTSGANLDLYDNDTQSRIRTVDGRLHLVADYNNSIADSEIRFYVDNDHKISINSDGHLIPGDAGTQELGSATKEWADLYFANSKGLKLGSGQVADLYNDGTDTYFRNSVSNGQTLIRSGGNIWISDYAGNHRAAFRDNSAVDLYFDIENHATAKLSTTATGVSVHGEVAASQDYPNFRPTVDWNFAAEKKLDPRITYTRTGPASYIDENGLVKFVGDNTPRFDHDPVTRECKGLLIEPSRTNIFASSDAGNSAWVVDNSMTKGANSTDTKDPAGTYTACKLMSVASAGSSSQIYDQTSQSSGGVISVWAKKGTHNVLGIHDYSGGSGTIRAWFDLNTGEHRCEGGSKVAAGVQSSGNDSNTTNMIEYPNGWYRCIYYEAANMTYAFFRICDFDSDTEASASSNSIYLWGLQGEVNVTYATSHIPCNTGSMPGTITRGSDFAYLDGTAGTEFDDIYRTDEGTFVLDWFNDPNGNHNDGYVFTVDDGSGNNRIAAVNSNGYQVTVTTGGSSQGTRDLGSINSGDNKIAFTYKLNDQATSLNGSDVSLDTSCTIPTSGLKYWWFGLRQGQYDLLGGYMKRIIYYPTRLPNNQLKTLSS